MSEVEFKDERICCELCKLQQGLLQKIEPDCMPHISDIAKHGIPKALNSLGGLIYICSTCSVELEARKQIQRNDKAILIKEVERELGGAAT